MSPTTLGNQMVRHHGRGRPCFSEIHNPDKTMLANRILVLSKGQSEYPLKRI